MQEPPNLFDRAAITRHRARAILSGPAMFMHEEAAFEIKERLKDVNRSFTRVAIVTGFPAFWQDTFPEAKVVSDDDLLALTEDSFDLVLHVMCLHQSNDPIGQLVQCNRALMKDGLLLAAFFGGQTLAELRSALTEAEVAVTGGLSPRLLPMIDIRDAGALLQRAGFALPVADSDQRRVSYADTRALMHDLRAMAETNCLKQRNRVPPGRLIFEHLENLYAKTGDRVVATFEMLYLTGWAPDESQQKPLRPGSATTRLADALKTVEMDETAAPVLRGPTGNERK